MTARGAFSTLERAARVLAIVGGLIAVGISALVVASVVSRGLGWGGVRGDFELVQMATAVAFFFFLPLCQMRRGNVMVDTFTGRLPPRARRVIDALWDLVFAGFMGLIAWRLWVGAMEAFQSHTTTMVLSLEVGYAIAACAVIAGILAFVTLATAAERAFGSRP
jgi:TRAP-type C4-dicarboxylate transport system permease small subunit